MKTTKKNPPRNWLALVICVTLGLATASVYWPVHNNQFIVLDDQDYIVKNPQVQAGITGTTLKWALVQSYAGNWHPLTWVSHMLDCEMFGLNPGPHHLVNAGWHITNSLLLFLLLERLTGARWRSTFVAALFALHPLHVESVAWASERKDVLSTFFFILTLGAYTRYTELKQQSHHPKIRKWLYYGLALTMFALGLMSKSMLVTLPFVLLLLDFWPLGRLPITAMRAESKRVQNLILEKIPFFALSGMTCGLTIWSQSSGHAVGSVESFPIDDRIANSLTAYLGYIQKTLWPTKLSVFYPFPARMQIEAAGFALLLLLIATTFFIANAKKRPYLLVGWFWFLGTLIPVIGLVQVGSHALADRYTYIPLIGLFIMAAWGANEVSSHWKNQKLLLTATALLVLMTCSLLTFGQVVHWQNNTTLFRHATEVDDQNYMAWSILGDMQRLEGRPEQATDYLQRAIKLRPNSEIPWYGLAISLMALNKPQEAENAFQTALKLSPANPHILNDYAKLLLNLGRLDEAADQLKKARQANPYLIGPRLNQVVWFQKLGRFNDAVNECQEILKLEPANQLVRALMGSLYTALGQPAQAVATYRTVLVDNPTNFNARIGLGLALIETKDFATAESEFSTVVRTDPRNALALDGLGFTLSQTGRFKEANTHFLASLEVQPSNPMTHLHYAMCLTAQGQTGEAIREYRKVLELDANQLVALNNLAWTLATFADPSLRNGPDSVQLAERACRLTNGQQPFYLGTLAAAYAESGRFPEAIATAEKARDLANNLGWAGVGTRNEQLLELYRAGKAFHEPMENITQ